MHDSITLPKSEYVKNKIKRMKFTARNRDYAHTLLKLERWAVGGPSGWADSMNFTGTVCNYEKDYTEILKELNPAKYGNYLKGKQNEKERMEKLVKQAREEEKKEQEEDKDLWKSCSRK